MAFKDIELVLYDGKIKLTYKDQSHRYYVRKRKDWDLPETNVKAWDSAIRPAGVTTVLGDTLEKKGLMTWPMGLALRELFGFYDFTTESGEHKTGFSKGKGSLWEIGERGDLYMKALNADTALPIVLSASKAWQRKQKKGADIGSIVHDAIEHYIKNEPYEIDIEYMNSIKECQYETEKDQEQAFLDFEEDVSQAKAAFDQFTVWWTAKKPELLGAEDLVYSLEHNIPGTFDGLIRLDGKVILCDWKTSNASSSAAAAMPEGINYQYFIQSAIYAMAWMEMGREKIDDLMIVSCRKDGGFTTITASELGWDMDAMIKIAKSVIYIYEWIKSTKQGLIAHAVKGETNDK